MSNTRLWNTIYMFCTFMCIYVNVQGFCAVNNTTSEELQGTSAKNIAIVLVHLPNIAMSLYHLQGRSQDFRDGGARTRA